MADSLDLADDLLRGGGKIAQFVYRDDYAEDAEKATKRFYHEVAQAMWPVFRLPGSTILHALKSQLHEHAVNRSREVAAEIAVAAKKAKAAMAVKVKPKRRRSARLSPKQAA